jgi:hypothetical protein
MDYDEYKNYLREWIEYNIYGLNYCLEKEKLISLISEVLERLPSEDQEIILYKRQVRFIAPITANCITEQVFIDPLSVRNEETSLCRCSKCNEPHITPKNGNYDIMVGVWLVCLSADILKRSKKASLYTIAHEIAHAYLEHPKTASKVEKSSKREIDADRQVIKWGFESELRHTPFNYIYGTGSRQNESSLSFF